MSPVERQHLAKVRRLVDRLVQEFDNDAVEQDPMEFDVERVSRNVQDLDAALTTLEVAVEAAGAGR